MAFLKERVDNILIKTSRPLVDRLIGKVALHVEGAENLAAAAGQRVTFPFFPHGSHADEKAVFAALSRHSPSHASGLIIPGKREYWFGQNAHDKDTLRDEADRYIRSLLPPIFFPEATIMPLSFENKLQAGKDAVAIMNRTGDSDSSILINHEGTRQERPFYDRLMYELPSKMSYKLRYPFIPTVVKGSRELLPRGSAIPRVSGNEVTVKFGAPVDPANFESYKAFHQALIQSYKEMCADLYPEGWWEPPKTAIIGAGQMGRFFAKN